MKQIDIEDIILNENEYKNYIFLDVRDPIEFRGRKVKNAFNFPLSYLNNGKMSLSSLDITKKYLVYCKAGVRSADFVRKMEKLGFNATNLFINWEHLEKLNSKI